MNCVKTSFNLLLLVLLLSLIVFSDIPKLPALANGTNEAGRQALARGDLTAAEKSFKTVLRQEPGNVESLVGLADVAMAKNDLTTARTYVTRAASKAPASALVLDTQGRYFFLRKQYVEAEAALRKSVSADAKWIVPHLDLAELLDFRGEKAAAAAEYRSAIELDPRHAGAHFGLASSLFQTGDMGAAKLEYQKAAEYAPADPRPQVGLGRLYTRTAAYDQALTAYNNALKLDANSVDAFLGRAEVRINTHQSPSADLEAATKLAGRSAATQMQIAMLYQLAGAAEAAEAAYKRVIALDPRNALACHNLNWLLVDRKQRASEALNYAKRAVELNANSPQFQDGLGWAMRANGDLAGADRVLTRASKMPKANAEIYYHLGVVQADNGNKAMAIASLKKAIAENPRFLGNEEARLKLQQLER